MDPQSLDTPAKFSPTKHEPIIEESKGDRSLRYSEYVEVGLDDIRLEEKKESDNAIYGELAESDIIAADQVNEDLKSVLRGIELPALRKIEKAALENDIFTIMIRPPVMRYLVTAFLACATIGSIFA
jgi:hypothetical protein